MSDRVERTLDNQIEVCRGWIRSKRYDDFTVTVVIPLSDEYFHWCTWIRLSPLTLGPDYGIQVLMDHDTALYENPLVVGRPIEERPGAPAFAFIVDPYEKLQALTDPDPIQYQFDPAILRRDPAVRIPEPFPPDYGRGTEELCRQYGGAFQRRTDDGLWVFLVPSRAIPR